MALLVALMIFCFFRDSSFRFGHDLGRYFILHPSSLADEICALDGRAELAGGAVADCADRFAGAGAAWVFGGIGHV